MIKIMHFHGDFKSTHSYFFPLCIGEMFSPRKNAIQLKCVVCSAITAHPIPLGFFTVINCYEYQFFA